MSWEQKVRENKARRVAARLGLVLVKSRSRNPKEPGYGLFMLVDAADGHYVYGAAVARVKPTADLGGVEEFLGIAP